MTIFARILVAVDESPASERAVVAGARLAREHDGSLILRHAVDWVPLVLQMASTARLDRSDAQACDANVL